MKAEVVTRTETDWVKVKQWLDEKEENPDDKARWEFLGDPYGELRSLSKSCEREIRVCGKSKRWWKKQWKPLRKKS